MNLWIIVLGIWIFIGLMCQFKSFDILDDCVDGLKECRKTLQSILDIWQQKF